MTYDVDPLVGFDSTFLRRADRAETDGAFLSLFDLDIVSLLLRRRFDVLWIHGYYSATHLIAAATQLLRGGQVLVREEQTLLNSRPIWKQVLKWPLLRLLFSRSLGLYIGTRNQEWFHHYGMSSARLFHVPFCVDNDRLRAEASRLRPRRSELRAAFCIPAESGPVIASVARIAPEKQPLLVLDAFSRVRASHRCALLIVGSGPCEGELRDHVAKRSIPDVYFAGFLGQTQIANAYAASDVAVLASRSEPWGLVVNEAMNFGLPVVVSDKVGCAADLVMHGENGYIFSHDRPEELAGYLAQLVEDESRRKSFGRCAAETIAPWNYDAAADGLVSAMRAAVGPERWAQAENGARFVDVTGARVAGPRATEL